VTKNELLELTKTAGANPDAMLRYQELARLLAKLEGPISIMYILNQVHRNGMRDAAGRLAKDAAQIVKNMDALDELAKDI
jgi:hypothetical protein